MEIEINIEEVDEDQQDEEVEEFYDDLEIYIMAGYLGGLWDF